MENPFSVIDSRLGSLQNLLLELFNTLQSTALCHGPEKPINIEEASLFLGIPTNTLYSLTSRREIPFCKPGKHLLFYKSELNEWVQTSRQKTVAEIQAEARKGVRNGK